MKVSELSGALLDYWVARAEGATGVRVLSDEKGEFAVAEFTLDSSAKVTGAYYPSTNWLDGGPIIERDQIFLQPPSEVHYNGGPNHGWRRYNHWRATVSARTRTLSPKNEVQEAMNVRGVGRGAGDTPLLAAMRAKVASHYGDEVPDEVTK